jgi:hypothetical protein
MSLRSAAQKVVFKFTRNCNDLKNRWYSNAIRARTGRTRRGYKRKQVAQASARKKAKKAK